MKSSRLHIILFIFASLTLTSCVGRFVADGEHVLDRIELDVAMADSSAVTPEVRDALKKVENYYTQKPNSKFLLQGLPIGKWIYCFSGTSNNAWNNYMHRLGQAPVIYDESRSIRTAHQIDRLLNSKGCFGSTVSFDTLAIKGYNIQIGFHVLATHRYTIDEVVYRTEDPKVRKLLHDWEAESLLKTGTPYDQDNIAAERNRIVNNLREAGYYYANNDLITFLVDTTYHNRRLSIDVIVDSRNLKVYHINNIYIYPNSTAGLRNRESAFDTLIYSYSTTSRFIDYAFVYDKPMSIKPQTISRAMTLFPGMTYRPRWVNNAYNSLLNLRNFKYINIEFSESPSSNDSLALLDAHVRLINSDQQRISLSVELTNASPIGVQDSGNFVSNGNIGVETAIEYQHKNVFGGAELLKVKGSLLLELPKLIFRNGIGAFHDNFSAFETSLDASLDMPVFLLPFAHNITWQRIHPHTLISVGGSYQYRYYFERLIVNSSFGYTWNQRIGTGLNSRTAQHQLTPVDLTFVRIFNFDEEFLSRIVTLEGILRAFYQYTSHFIMAARYDYAYSTQQYGLRQNFSIYRFSAETAGNLLNSISHLVDGKVDSNNIRQFFDVPFSQYIRFSGEYTRYLYHGKRNSFVARCLIGIGIPYGNSMDMPYEKSFFGGGPTTMRAWQLRHLGPGGFNASFIPEIERVGDLQLVINLEERFHIFSIFEGALFADIGNVWLVNPSDMFPGGELKWKDFYKEIAVGVGLGLRVNVSVATLRLDLALPLYDPGFDPEQRFRPPHWNIKSLVTNFGIGYPF